MTSSWRRLGAVIFAAAALGACSASADDPPDPATAVEAFCSARRNRFPVVSDNRVRERQVGESSDPALGPTTVADAAPPSLRDDYEVIGMPSGPDDELLGAERRVAKFVHERCDPAGNRS